jgi:hypothetical protein
MKIIRKALYYLVVLVSFAGMAFAQGGGNSGGGGGGNSGGGQGGTGMSTPNATGSTGSTSSSKGTNTMKEQSGTKRIPSAKGASDAAASSAQ